MADKTRIIDITDNQGTFSFMLSKFTGKKQDYNYSDMSLLRKLLSNEKARMLNIIKTKKPTSIYALAKMLERDFKSVRDDVLLLKKFGFISLIEENKLKSKRKSFRPVLEVNSINIQIRV